MKYLESEVINMDSANTKLTNFFSTQDLQQLKEDYRNHVIHDVEGQENKSRPKLQLFVKFILEKYTCSGPDNSPICKYDYTSLNVLNENFIFAVQTKYLPHENEKK